MSKKNFKDNAANLDRFFSAAETHDTQSTQEPLRTQETQKTHYRINLKLRPEFREYLDTEAWKARKSITEYINDLIQADKDSKDI